MTDGEGRPRAPGWRAVLADVRARLHAAGVEQADIDARRIIEDVTGYDGASLVLHLDDTATALGTARAALLAERRAGGEPLQYVLGHWAFRSLDLLVDRRVLIPRPETEWLVETALCELDRLTPRGQPATVVDLGTGSGAIALAIACERWPSVDVWGTDASRDALAVASANLAGLGRRGTRVRLAGGDWYEALPVDLRGAVDLIVANPPYVADPEALELPVAVREWEPIDALVAGPTGLEAIERVVAGARRWLRAPGALVVEIGESQGAAAIALAAAAGFATTEVRTDLTGRPRALVARHDRG